MESGSYSLLEIAARNSTIAKRILWDEPKWTPEAAMHIARAWECLLRFDESRIQEEGAGEAAPETKAADSFDQLTNSIDFSPVFKRWKALGAVEDANDVQKRWREDLEQFSAAELFPALESGAADRLEGHLELLDATEKTLRRNWYRDHGKLNPQLSLRQVLSFGVLPALLILVSWYLLRGEPAWVDYYFENTELAGTARAGERQREIQFNWSQTSPHEEIALEQYSARFFSCLQVDTRSTVSFELGSDDGSRLFVAGESLVDIWSPHAFMTKTRGRTFEPGVYPLKLEYFQEYGGASLRLNIRAEGEAIAMSQSVRLRAPKTVGPDSVACQ